MTSPAEQEVTLPTMRFLLVAWIGTAAVGVVWAVGAVILGRPADDAVAGLLAAGVVAVASTVSLVALRPWRPRTLATWPMVWVAGSFLRMFITLGGALLLYSASPYGTVSHWMAVVAAYLAAMVGETRVYAWSMRRFTPA